MAAYLIQLHLHPSIAIISLKITSIISILFSTAEQINAPPTVWDCVSDPEEPSQPGASKGISGFPEGEMAGDTGPCSHDSAAPLQFSHFKHRAASSKSSMPECRVESPIQSYISLCTDRWKAIITSLSSWWVMGSHNSGEIWSAAAEAQVVPGAGCLCENPGDVVWCLALSGMVAICSVVVVSQAVCKSSLVPPECWMWKQARGVKAFNWSRIDFRLIGGQGEKACSYSIVQVKETKDFTWGVGSSQQY